MFNTHYISIMICALLGLMALCAPLLSPFNFYTPEPTDYSFIAPLHQGHLLGTDEFGRDTFSGILYALRTSFLIGGGSSLFALCIGSLLGLMAAYKGGIFDNIIRRLIDMQLAVPSFLLALIFVGFWGQGKLPLFLALSLTQWAYFAQAARAIAKRELQKDYIDQAKLLPHSDFFIVTRHLALNCLPLLLPLFSAKFARGVAIEAALSFLGTGVPLTEPSFGLFIAQGYGYFMDKAPWLCIFPALFLITLVMTLTLSADALNRYIQRR